MGPRIFKNIFFLSFKELKLDKKYTEQKLKAIGVYYNLFGVIQFLISVSSSAENLFFKNNAEGISQKFVVYFSIITTIYYFFSLIFGCIIKNQNILLYLNYINYVCITFTCGFLKYPLIHFVKVSPVVMIVLLLFEILARIYWVILNVMDFKENFFLNIINICIIWGVFFPTSDPYDNHKYILYNFLCYSLFFGIISYFFYVIEKEKKPLFITVRFWKNRSCH
jgi:hypothetical protein